MFNGRLLDILVEEGYTVVGGKSEDSVFVRSSARTAPDGQHAQQVLEAAAP